MLDNAMDGLGGGGQTCEEIGHEFRTSDPRYDRDGDGWGCEAFE